MRFLVRHDEEEKLTKIEFGPCRERRIAFWDFARR